jgi:hypothetical protein
MMKADFRLQFSNFKLQIANCKLRIANCELQIGRAGRLAGVAGFARIRTHMHEPLKSGDFSYGFDGDVRFQISNCKMQIAKCKMEERDGLLVLAVNL